MEFKFENQQQHLYKSTYYNTLQSLSANEIIQYKV